MRGPVWLSVLLLVVAGCTSVYQVPQTPPGRKEVFEAARVVIKEHYPMSAPVVKSDHIFAITPVEMMGGAKSRRQISVWVAQNHTGAWEPRVRIVLHQEEAEPTMQLDAGTTFPSKHPEPASAVVVERWRPLQTLPAEEQKLTAEILKRIQI